MEPSGIQHILTEISPGVLHFGGTRMALLEVQDGFWSIRRQMEALTGPQLTNSVLQQAGANGGAAFARSFGCEADSARQSRLFTDCLQAYQTAGFGRFEIQEMSWPVGRVKIQAQDTFEAWMVRQRGLPAEGPVCAYTSGVLVGFINVITQRQDVVCIEHCCQARGDPSCEFELLPTSAAGDQTVVAFSPDPKLGRQINLLEMLFERMPMSIVVIDRDFKLVRFNPTWSAYIDRYTPSHAWQVIPGAYLFDLEPGTEETFIPLFKRVFQGETVRQDAVRIESQGMESFWDVVISPVYEGDQIVGLLGVSIDASERVQAEKKLTETLVRLAESESMLRSVIENARHFAIYRVQVDQDAEYFGKVVLASPSVQELLGVEDPYNFKDWFQVLHPDDYEHVYEASRRSLQEANPYNQFARIYNQREKRWRWIQTISNPCFDSQGRLTHFDGMLIDLTDQKEAELALQEINATLEQRVGERTRELATLLEISQNVSSTLELAALLQLVLDQLKTIVEYKGASLMVVEEDRLRFLAYRGPIRSDEIERLRIPFDSTTVNFEIIRSGKPLIIPDLRGDSAAAQVFRKTVGDNLETLFGYIRCWMGIPLIVKGRVMGMMTLDHSQPNFYTPNHATLALAFANQAASAIENARLYERLHESAAAEERNRLARDLHDAVSQTLFSANLIAESLPKLWERNPEAGKQKLEELGLLTRSALSEMRTLLLELRPASLIEMDLADLLRHLANAFTGRSRIPVRLTIEGQVDPDLKVKEVIYRVVQESLNNVTKHAQASEVGLHLQRSEAKVDLAIRDDGNGFDPQQIAPDSLGLGIMRERVETIGAALRIQSAPGAGTQIDLSWVSPQVLQINASGNGETKEDEE